MNNGTVVLFNDRKADCYYEKDIYDPNNPDTGKVIPTLYSIVIKSDGTLWYVKNVDETTYESTLAPCSYILTDEETNTQMVTYGSDRFCIYQDTRTSPFKLVIDAKLLFYGNNLEEYALYRVNGDGQEEVISIYIDPNGAFKSDRIPMASISEEHRGYRYPTNCHTVASLYENEPVILRVFNNLGTLAAEITLYVRNAIWWNDLNSHINPIIRLNARCLQMRGDDFFIYEKQDPSHLNIQPYLEYADGTTVDLVLDNMKCHIYGLDDFIASYPGYSQKIIIKYFLNYRENSLQVLSGAEKRFLVCEKNIVVQKNTNSYSVKVSPIPVVDPSSGNWKLRFFAYSDRRDAVFDITDLVTFEKGYEFDGYQTSWGKEQKIQFSYDLQSIFKTDDPMPGAQVIFITVWNPLNTYVRYTFRDTEIDGYVYGVDGSITRRPIIWYDPELEQYFIPTSIFNNWEAVVDSFYRLARPPYDSKVETTPPEPTHFTIRDAFNGQQIIGGSIGKESFAAIWPTIVGTPVLKGQVVIVEFLKEVNGQLTLLYGVPVDVDRNDHSYNT